MEEGYAAPEVSTDDLARLRDMEERQRLLKDRIVLIGQSVVSEREKNTREILEMKKTVIQLKEEHKRMKELLERITEQLGSVARKEELNIMQKQLDLLRENK